MLQGIRVDWLEFIRQSFGSEFIAEDGEMNNASQMRLKVFAIQTRNIKIPGVTEAFIGNLIAVKY